MVGDGSCGVGCLGSWQLVKDREREDGRRWILWGRLPRLGQVVKDREREDGRRWILWGRLPRLGQLVKDREREMVGDGSCGVGCLGWGSWSRIERERGW